MKRVLLVAALLVVGGSLFLFGLKGGKESRIPVGPESEKKEGVGSAPVLLQQAKEKESRGDLLAARGLYQRLLLEFASSPEVARWQRKIEELNIQLILSSTLTPKSIQYEVKAGDSLVKIARIFKTTVELIKKSNNLDRDTIIPGRRLKVWAAPFSIVVDKSQNILILKSDEEVIKTYVVSTGTNNSTPVGTFQIVNKIAHPTWFKAGAIVPPTSPENVLGTRWLGFNLPGYGIHGTTDPASLGKQVTEGCVRMANPDVEELYMLVPEGSEVTIVD